MRPARHRKLRDMKVSDFFFWPERKQDPSEQRPSENSIRERNGL
jgi:hypothetical protein